MNRSVTRNFSVPGGLESTAPSRKIWDIDCELLHTALNRNGFTLRHRLADHPLFTLPSLVELSRKLPAERVEYNAGDLPVNTDPARTPKTGLSIEETIRRIEECGSWMVMKNVEEIDEYRDLMDRCLDEIEAAMSPRLRMRRREAFVFVSSPSSVTPYHFDPEYNFLLQIRGAKTVHVFPRTLLSEEEQEERFSFRHRNLVFQDAYQSLAASFALVPGSAVHIPIAAPHWVKNGENVSISFSVTFRTSASEREAALYRFNAKLRARGVRPAPVHRSPVRDGLKLVAYHAARTALKPMKAFLGSLHGGPEKSRPARYSS